jgi:hypothetical protein
MFLLTCVGESSTLGNNDAENSNRGGLAAGGFEDGEQQTWRFYPRNCSGDGGRPGVEPHIREPIAIGESSDIPHTGARYSGGDSQATDEACQDRCRRYGSASR